MIAWGDDTEALSKKMPAGRARHVRLQFAGGKDDRAQLSYRAMSTSPCKAAPGLSPFQACILSSSLCLWALRLATKF